MNLTIKQGGLDFKNTNTKCGTSLVPLWDSDYPCSCPCCNHSIKSAEASGKLLACTEKKAQRQKCRWKQAETQLAYSKICTKNPKDVLRLGCPFHLHVHKPEESWETKKSHKTRGCWIPRSAPETFPRDTTLLTRKNGAIQLMLPLQNLLQMCRAHHRCRRKSIRWCGCCGKKHCGKWI